MEDEKRYVATIRRDEQLEDVEFTISGNPVEYLWERYGMSTYIADLKEHSLAVEIALEVEEEVGDTEEKETEEAVDEE